MRTATEEVVARRCAFCHRPHPVSDYVAEESPFCTACLHERVALRAAQIDTNVDLVADGPDRVLVRPAPRAALS